MEHRSPPSSPTALPQAIARKTFRVALEPFNRKNFRPDRGSEATVTKPQSRLTRQFWGEATIELIETINDDCLAIEFFKRFGGSDKVCVPHTPRPDHPWNEVLGPTVFQRVSKRFGGERIAIPNAKRLLTKRHAIERALLANPTGSRRALARQFDVTERSIRQIAKEMRDGGEPIPRLLREKKP